MVQNVTVYLDNERPKFSESESVRCGFIVARDTNGRETFHNDLIDNSEYPSLKELVVEVAAMLKVQRGAVWIAG